MSVGESPRAALVLGASGDIGAATAFELARGGADVALAGRSAETLKRLAKAMQDETGRRVVACPGDLSDPATPSMIVDRTVDQLGRLDILVTSAAQFRQGDVLQLSPEDWTDGFAAMFFGAVAAVKAAWPHLAAARGHIVMVSGVFAIRPSARAALPSAIAAAVQNFAKSTAELGLPQGISVNCVLPGPIDGRRLDEQLSRFAAERGLSRELALQAYAERFGIERIGRPEDVAKLIGFLTDPANGYLRGASVVIDGGISRAV